MANYGYIYLKRPVNSENFEHFLKKVVKNRFKGKMQVKKTEFNDNGPVWIVFIPNSASSESEAPKFNKAPEDFGFPVSLQSSGKTIAFRHVFNMFEYWCQGCIEEDLSDLFSTGVYHDSTGEITPPWTREYRSRNKFRHYLARNMKKPLSKDDKEFINRYESLTPKGWW